MTTLNPGYYNNTSCSPGNVEMPNSSLNPVTLIPSCNPIDKQLINTIISYLISNDIFILNQLTDTQQTPGLFNIYSYGKANSFLAKNFDLLDRSGIEILTLTANTHSINSLGDYYGPMWETNEDFIIKATNIILDGQPVLRTDLPSVLKDIILTIDDNGIVNETLASDIKTMVPTLQEVTDAGNSTTNRIVLLNATTDYELVPYGQMIDSIAQLLTLDPDIIQIILDWLNAYDFSMYIKTSEKATLGGVLTLDLGGKVPLNQIPLLTLQQICSNSNTTNTTIVLLDALNPNEVVTLGQLNALISAGVGTLDQVLFLGNLSGLPIVLSDETDYTLTLRYNGYSWVYDHRDTFLSLSATPEKITFLRYDVGYNNTVDLYTGHDTDLTDRLLVNMGGVEAYLVTSNDFGHTPVSGLAIDADMLDGVHASEFILLSDFPVDVTGLVNGQLLVFDGVNWIPGTVSGGGGTGLTYFVESLSSSTATLVPTSTSHNTFLKTNLHKNLILGSMFGTITGGDNFLYSTTTSGPTVAGSYNIAFSNSGILSGSRNIVFTDAVNISALSTDNFVFKTDSQIGTNVGAISNIIMVNSTALDTVNQFQGSYSVLLQNTNTKFSVLNSANSSVLINNTGVGVGANDIVSIKTYGSVINGIYSTIINGYQVTVAGQRSFVSGTNLTANSYANVAFGSFGTVEVGGTTNLVVDRDRLFFVGSGSALGNLRNAITVWKSGATEISGVLKLGSATANETNAIIEGSLRYNNTDKAIEIYRTAAWSKDLLNNTVTDYIAWSKIKYPALQNPAVYTVTGGDVPLLINAGTIDLSLGPNAVNIDAFGTMTVVTPGYYHIHFNIGILIESVTAGDNMCVKCIGNNVTQNITLSRVLVTTGNEEVCFNGSLFAKLELGDTLAFYMMYLTGLAVHNVTPLGDNTTIDFVEVKNVQPGTVVDNTLGWLDNLRQIYIRNTSLNNINLSGETKFQVTDHNVGAKTITLDNDIPIEVDGIPYDNTRSWALTKGFAHCVDIDSIDVTRRIITYTTLTGTISNNDYVEFFNPFMNYEITTSSPILTNGAPGSWNETYMQSGGMWKKNDGTFVQIINGLNIPYNGGIPGSGTLRLGKAISIDLVSWSLDNSGNHIYAGGLAPFTESWELNGLYTQANPVKTVDNTFMSIYIGINAGRIGSVGWVEFDEDFNILSKSTSPIIAPGYPLASGYQVGGLVYFEDKWLLYVVYRPTSTPSTWKVLELEMDDIKSGTVNVVREVTSGAAGGVNVWNAQHNDAVIPFVYNNTIKLWVAGTGQASDPGSLYLFSGNRSYGLIHRNVVGSVVSFSVDTRNPIFANPINGTDIWNYPDYWDHIGGGLSHYTEGTTMYMYPTFNAGSNTYKVAAIRMDNSI